MHLYASRWRVFGIEFLSGLFFLIAASIIVYFTAVINGKEILFDKYSTHYTIAFDHVGDLSVNDRVCARGLKVGQVTGLEMGKDFKNVQVTISLYQPIKLYRDYRMEIKTSSMFGGQFILIDTGHPEKGELTDFTQLIGTSPVDLFRSASELIATLKQDEQFIREKFIEGQLVDNINKTAQQLQITLNDFQKKESSVYKMFNDPSFYNQIMALMQNLNKGVHSLNKMTEAGLNENSVLAKLLFDESMQEKVTNLLENAQTTFKESKTLILSLQDSVKSLNTLTQQANNSKNSLSLFLNDEGKFYTHFQELVCSVKALTVQLNDGQGSLGLLISDDQLYFDMRKMIHQVNEMIERFRGQTPVESFWSFFFGVL